MKKNPAKVKQGKKNRKVGSAFEKKVRSDLEKKGWIVDKWTNNVEFAKSIGTQGSMKPSQEYPAFRALSGKLVPSKPKFNPFTKSLMMNSAGFPDFIVFFEAPMQRNYLIIGVECKTNGKLDKIEKDKCQWLLEHKIFSKILIASPGEKKGEIKYEEFDGSSKAI